MGCVIQQTPSDWIKIVERSPNVGFWVFSQNLHHQGNLSDKELLLLKDVVSEWGWEPDYTIYVRTPAKEAWERLSKRGRSCEESVPVSLIQQLEKRHDEFIENGQCGKHIHLDGAQNRQASLDNALDIIQKIKVDARNHLDPSPRTGHPTSTTAWQCHHSQRNPVHIDHDNLVSATAVPDNPDTIEVWV